MKSFKILASNSRRGRKFLQQLRDRGDDLLDPKILKRSGRIVESVRQGRDRALLEAVRRFDGSAARSLDELRLNSTEADGDLPAGVEEALERSIVAVERFHERQVHPGYWLSENGVELVERRTPFSRVGIYVPGGRAAYPSTVVMTAVPARLAGVGEIVVVTPPRSWESSSALRYVLDRLGITEVWGLGGA
ncbi:MAG: histidinol dehydrogenase, partial [Acidobacteriota bacterium]